MRAFKIGSTCFLMMGSVSCAEEDGAGPSSDELTAVDSGAGGSPASETSDTGTGGDPVNADAVADEEGLTLSWKVFTYEAVGSPIEGARVCVRDHAEIPCATTSAEGGFVLTGLPANTVLDLTAEKSGYMKTLQTIETSGSDMTGLDILTMWMPPADVDTSAWGTPVDSTKGSLVFFAVTHTGGIRGATFTISPDVGSEPIYWTPNAPFEPGGTSTGPGGGGIFVNLPDGTYTLTIGSAAQDCVGINSSFAGYGIPVEGEPAVTAHVVSGYVTMSVGMLCTAADPTESDGGDGGG